MSSYGEKLECYLPDGDSCLSSLNLDRKSTTSIGVDPGPNTPFLVQEKWYLPVLRPDYDATQDNLIVIDASSRRDFYQVMDALGVYGCRYARLLLVFQEAFESAPQTKGLYRYPIGHILSLPALDKNGAHLPIPELLLPFAMNLLAAAMASSASRTLTGISSRV